MRLEGFVHLERPLSKNNQKQVIKMNLGHYSNVSKSILFSFDLPKNKKDFKEFIIKKFFFIKKEIEMVMVFIDKKTVVFNQTDF